MTTSEVIDCTAEDSAIAACVKRVKSLRNENKFEYQCWRESITQTKALFVLWSAVSNFSRARQDKADS